MYNININVILCTLYTPYRCMELVRELPPVAPHVIVPDSQFNPKYSRVGLRSTVTLLNYMHVSLVLGVVTNVSP